MRGPNQLKREFIKKWANGLQIYTSSNKEMSFLERKRAIKLSADVAMASTRTNTTCWGRALIEQASNDDDISNLVVEHVLRHPENNNNNNTVPTGRLTNCNINNGKIKITRSKKILRKSSAIGRRRKINPHSSCVIAKRMMKKRTQLLKSLVPGGNLMDDDVFLIQEALDYVISLQVQVNVMRQLAWLSGQIVDRRDT